VAAPVDVPSHPSSLADAGCGGAGHRAAGCLVGLLGGVAMHQPRLRAAVGQWLWALVPARMKGRKAA
jgi:hypothetical protein